MGFTDFGENEMLVTTTTGTFVGLFSVAPTETGGGTELVGAGYTRVAATFSAPVAGSTSNSVKISFPAATGPWVTATHFGTFDAATGPNLRAWAPLATPKTAALDDVLSFAIGALTISID